MTTMHFPEGFHDNVWPLIDQIGADGYFCQGRYQRIGCGPGETRCNHCGDVSNSPPGLRCGRHITLADWLSEPVYPPSWDPDGLEFAYGYLLAVAQMNDSTMYETLEASGLLNNGASAVKTRGKPTTTGHKHASHPGWTICDSPGYGMWVGTKKGETQ